MFHAQYAAVVLWDKRRLARSPQDGEGGRLWSLPFSLHQASFMEAFVAPAKALAVVRWQMVNKWLFRMAGG